MSRIILLALLVPTLAFAEVTTADCVKYSLQGWDKVTHAAGTYSPDSLFLGKTCYQLALAQMHLRRAYALTLSGDHFEVSQKLHRLTEDASALASYCGVDGAGGGNPVAMNDHETFAYRLKKLRSELSDVSTQLHD